MVEQVGNDESLLGNMKPFLRNPEEFSSITRTKLLDYFAILQIKNSLKVELVAVITAGKPFVQVMYKLEGDGPVAVECRGGWTGSCVDVM